MSHGSNGSPLDVPITKEMVDAECTAESIISICQILLPQWSTFSTKDITVTVITGGLTNKLYKAEPSNRSRPVLVRVYGENTEITVNRATELQILEFVTKHGFGAKVLGLFGNGRLEQFLDSRPLDIDDIRHPSARSKIAKIASDLHNLAPNITTPQPGIMHGIRSYFAYVKEMQFTDEESKKQFKDLFDLEKIKNAIQKAETQCTSIASPILLCHNDLLPENLLLLEKPGMPHTLEESEIRLIDFEYSSYSYRGFDLAGFFAEHQGNTIDTNLYPSEKHRREFLEYYLKYSSGRSNVADNPTVDQLLRETDFFTPLTHCLWGLWSIIQARYSKIDFDYFEYASKRLSLFLDRFSDS